MKRMEDVTLRVLCAIAHPDDECFAFGGALALAAARGIETRVVCLTDGQAATARGDAANGAELGAMRREELKRSCDILGVTAHELLNYQDGRLEFVDFAAVAGELVERMRRWRPDVVLSFGLDGGLNTHADHMMASMLTTAAFHWAGRAARYPEAGPVYQPSRLFLLSTDMFLEDRQPPLPMPWTVKLDVTEVLPRKLEAFRAHTSQAPLMERTRDHFNRHGQFEFYSLVASTEAGPAEVGEDLFAGLDPNKR